MNKYFSFKNKKIEEDTPEEKKYKEILSAQRNQFIKELVKKFQEEGVEEEVKELILNNMVCFGPTPSAGTNFLISKSVKPGQSFLEKASKFEL